jgi:cytochrome b
VSYLRGAWTAVPGHNPLGALSVIALLALLAAQVTLGLFAVDVDGLESGPLSIFVSFDAGRTAADWHEDTFNVLVALVVLHVLAILYYLLAKKQNLTAAMWHGSQDGSSAQDPEFSGAVRLWIGIVLAVGFAWLVAGAFGRG